MPFVGSRSEAIEKMKSNVDRYSYNQQLIINVWNRNNEGGVRFMNDLPLASAGFPNNDFFVQGPCKIFPQADDPRRADMRSSFLSIKSDGKEQFTMKYDGIGSILKPTAARLLCSSNISDDEFANQDFTTSHLCHNGPLCHNINHICIESLAINKGRNGCAGGTCCRHQPPCLIPGPYVLNKPYPWI